MKKAIIVGATSGIGRALALKLADNNYQVGITGRREELLDKLRGERPGKFISRSFDVTVTDNVTYQLEELTRELGGLDLLVLSSGTGELNDMLDTETDKKTIATNVTGFTCIANWAFLHFQKQKHGHFVGISSIGGLRGSRQAAVYNASKSYQINYLEGLRQKARRTEGSIHITDIRPGLVDTAMAKGEGLFWVMPVDKAVQQIFNAIVSKKRVAYVTRRWRLIAFLLKRIPGMIYEKI